MGSPGGYTEKLGMELREDVTVPEMGNFRWLSVGVPGQHDVAITLMAVPGPPVFDEDTREKIHELMARAPREACSSLRTTPGRATKSSRAAASSSRRSRLSSPTGSTPGCAIRPATRLVQQS
jgi:hypothetical protein